jgi:L-ascorbate metabolism protein UlaG (beta-lactamase superfamily)
MIIHYGSNKVLVDPCLNPKGSLPPYTLFRKRPRLNPLVHLPANSESSLRQITHGLITHCRYGHFDHLDKAGTRLLSQKQVPVFCNHLDVSYLRHRHIKTIPLKMNQKNEFLTGNITLFPTAHGYGLIGKFMGPGAGYLIELPGEPTVYISGDTVFNQTVRDVLTNRRPDISIINAGTAALDLGRPILMPLEELINFIRTASGKVIAVHLDAFNHCLTNRNILREAVLKEGLSDKVVIPADGELLEF